MSKTQITVGQQIGLVSRACGIAEEDIAAYFMIVLKGDGTVNVDSNWCCNHHAKHHLALIALGMSDDQTAHHGKRE